MTCRICGPDHQPHGEHRTEEHSEDWVNLADARYTGEVIFMDTSVLDWALELAISENLRSELRLKAHVDRRIIQALLDTIVDTDAGDDTYVRDELQQILEDNPVREL